MWPPIVSPTYSAECLFPLKELLLLLLLVKLCRKKEDENGQNEMLVDTQTHRETVPAWPGSKTPSFFSSFFFFAVDILDIGQLSRSRWLADAKVNFVPVVC